jgi:hypothetical protein
MKKVYTGQRSQIAKWVLAFWAAAIMMHPTIRLHYPYFISDVRVVSYVLLCTECLI